jgi:class 3 adenylate cyclase
MAKPKPMTREELYDQLQAWKFGPPDQDPDLNRGLEDELWARCGRVRAVLVSDLSGFTRLTRARGILHFLAVFEQASKIGDAIFARHGGRFLKTAADNLFALFDTTGAAAACAQAMLHEADKLNAGVPHEDGHVRFCIGIGYGKILELSNDAFGDQVNVAFKLGEDLAKPGEILISESAVEDLRKSTTHKDLAALLQGPLAQDVGNVRLQYWNLPPRAKAS